MLRIRNPQDFGTGLLFLIIGFAGIYLGQDLAFGSARRMGPGFFPTIISALILLIGVVIGVRSLRVNGPAIEKMHLRPILMLTVALAVFGFLISQIGVVLTSILMMTIAAYARHDKVNILETLIFSLIVSAFVVLVFVYGLSQPMPLWWK